MACVWHSSARTWNQLGNAGRRQVWLTGVLMEHAEGALEKMSVAEIPWAHPDSGRSGLRHVRIYGAPNELPDAAPLGSA